MAYVACDLAEGLRPSEVTVSIKDLQGNSEFLRVERDFLAEFQGRIYLPIGVIYREGKQVLIELPHEADSGTNRLWVDEATIFEPEPKRRRAYA